MCTVIGFCGKFRESIISPLLDESRCRGIHAFGFSYFKKKKIITKKFLDYEKFKKTLISLAPDKFIAHFRYSTSGDWTNSEYNQPLEYSDLSLAFNGVISQKDKKGMEDEFGLSMPFENDGFILACSIAEGKRINKIGITYATCFLRQNSVFALRNRNRPLHVVRGNDFTIASSTKDIFIRAGIKDAEIIPANEQVELC